MTNFLATMYARKQAAQAAVQEKNPNRVLGGLKGQGVDHYSVLGEDGTERQVPTRAYVQGLEEKIRMMDSRLQLLEKQARRARHD